jgi:hypothetical protein
MIGEICKYLIYLFFMLRLVRNELIDHRKIPGSSGLGFSLCAFKGEADAEEAVVRIADVVVLLEAEKTRASSQKELRVGQLEIEINRFLKGW